MGKRKTKKVEVKKSKVPKLDKEFNCPFCNNVKTIGVKMNHRERLGHLLCRVCGVEYTSGIGKFDEAIDIYSNWIDKCCEVNNITQQNSSRVSEQESEDGTTRQKSEDKNVLIEGGNFNTKNTIYSNNKKIITFSMNEDINEDSYIVKDTSRGLRKTIAESEDEYDDLEDFIVEDETGGSRKVGNEKPNSLSAEISESQKENENSKPTGIEGDSSLYDIRNITSSSLMPKSFTVNDEDEDDGLFSD
ncbi:putative transcription elongation factor 1 [Cryptosporidium felis]|nr:putative transcription elongation factor 1 [Cryptosporidium felis]